jgi:hypothetical protein
MATWAAGIQFGITQQARRVDEIEQRLSGLEEMRADLKWIKKRLGGPDQ